MRPLVCLLGSLLASGCQLTQAGEAAPAVITNPGAEVKAELQQVIQQAIGGTKAKLADDVLTGSAQLYIEPALMKDAQGRPVMGRHHHKPEVFSLQIQGQECQLKHGASGQVFALKLARCETFRP